MRQHLAIVFDEPPLYPGLNGFDNLQILSGLRRFDQHWGSYILGSLKLGDSLLRQKGKSYSLGQKYRLAVAAALLRRPSYLILDEPTVGLDPSSWALVADCLRQMADEGAVIIVTGQDFSLMENLVDRVVILHNGVATFAGNLLDFLNRCPITVCVRSDSLEQIKNLFPSALINHDNRGSLLQITCDSNAAAETILLELQQMQITFHELAVKNVTLEEAFANAIKRRGGAST